MILKVWSVLQLLHIGYEIILWGQYTLFVSNNSTTWLLNLNSINISAQKWKSLTFK